jgi:hypothetical protein
MLDFEAFAGVSTKVAVSHVVMKCNVIEIYGRFCKKKLRHQSLLSRLCRWHVLSKRGYSFTKMHDFVCQKTLFFILEISRIWKIFKFVCLLFYGTFLQTCMTELGTVCIFIRYSVYIYWVQCVYLLGTVCIFIGYSVYIYFLGIINTVFVK